jgi:phosphatidate cytidylyltransferase
VTDVLDASRTAPEGMSKSFINRLLVVIVLLPVAVALIASNGWPFDLFVMAVFGTSAWEYGQLFRQGGYFPSRILIVIGVVALILMRALFSFSGSDLVLAILILLAMAVHMLDYEHGREKAATDFGITVAGILYLGWLGGYIISLRNLPAGEWWTLLALPAIWFADSGAYLVGIRIGRHKIAPRLSPKKSWEGYISGIVIGSIGAALLAALWHLVSPSITFQKGLILGFILSILAPIGDFGESMIKRQFGVKDSSNLLPGHGGVLDRIDSMLWVGVISYYLIAFLWIR